MIRAATWRLEARPILRGWPRRSPRPCSTPRSPNGILRLEPVDMSFDLYRDVVVAERVTGSPARDCRRGNRS